MHRALLVFSMSGGRDNRSHTAPSSRRDRVGLLDPEKTAPLVVTPVDLNRREEATLVGSRPPSSNQRTCDRGLSCLFLVGCVCE